MSKLVMKQERSPKGHWFGFFQGDNKSVIVEGSLAETVDEAHEYVMTHEFDSESDSEREIETTDKETGEVTKHIVKGKTYWYGNFQREGYKTYAVDKLRGKKADSVLVEYVD